MHITEFSFQFKGGRHYVQGPDIWDSFVRWMEDSSCRPNHIDIAFHKISNQNLSPIEVDEPGTVDAHAIARCIFQNGVQKTYALIPSGTLITSSRPYEEQHLTDNIQFDHLKHEASLSQTPGFSNMETWVSMTKALHHAIYPNVTGRWLFVRGRFHQIPLENSIQRFSVALRSSFNEKLTRTAAFADGLEVGDIFFAQQ